jgi:hypothetical protein
MRHRSRTPAQVQSWSPKNDSTQSIGKKRKCSCSLNSWGLSKIAGNNRSFQWFLKLFPIPPAILLLIICWETWWFKGFFRGFIWSWWKNSARQFSVTSSHQGHILLAHNVDAVTVDTEDIAMALFLGLRMFHLAMTGKNPGVFTSWNWSPVPWDQMRQIFLGSHWKSCPVFLHHLLWRTVMFRNRKFHHGHTVTMTAWCHGSSGHISYFAPNNGCLHQKNSQSVVSWVGKYKSGWSSLYFLLLLQIPHCFWLSHVKRSGHVSVVLALRLARAGRAGWKALTMVNNGLRLFIGNHAYEWLLMA